MPPPSAPDPNERALSERERAILADIEHDLDASAPALARAMASPMTRTAPLPAGLVEGGFLAVSLFLVLAAAGLVPGVVWALLGVVAAMVGVPWVMLRAFEAVERRGGRPPTSA